MDRSFLYLPVTQLRQGAGSSPTRRLPVIPLLFCFCLLFSCAGKNQTGGSPAGMTPAEELHWYQALTAKALSFNSDSILSRLDTIMPQQRHTDYRVTAYRYFLQGYRQLKLQHNDSASALLALMLKGGKVDTAKDIDLLTLKESALAKVGLSSGVNPRALSRVLATLERNKKYPSRFRWWAYSLAAEIYFGYSDWDKAESFLRLSLEAIPDTADYSLRGELMANFSRIETARKNFTKALAYEDTASALAGRAGDLKMIALSTAKKGLLYFELGDSIQAVALQMKALRLSSRLDKRMVGDHFYNLYVNLGWTFIHQGRYHLGLQYGRQALDFAGENQNALAAVHEVIYEAFKGLQQYDSSFQHMEEAFNAIIRNERMMNEREMAALGLNYELRQEKQHSSMLAARNRTKNALVVALLVILGLVVLLGYNSFKRRRLRVALENTELKERLLRSQMDPHFIFNIQTALQALARNNETVKLINYQDKFAKLLRISLENSRHPFVSLHREMEALEYYLSVQQMRFGYGFKYHIQYYAGYEEDDAFMIPPMLIQPFAENALDHGLGQLNHYGNISIILEKGDGQLHCTIEDNGQGLTKSREQSGKQSLSTEITRDRLKVLGKKLKKPVGLQIIDKAAHGLGSGVLVELLIPYIFIGQVPNRYQE